MKTISEQPNMFACCVCCQVSVVSPAHRCACVITAARTITASAQRRLQGHDGTRSFSGVSSVRKVKSTLQPRPSVLMAICGNRKWI